MAFEARRNAVKTAQWLKTNLVDTSQPPDIFGADFANDLSVPDRRSFAFGHWQFWFGLDLVDPRGISPEVFVACHLFHAGIEHGEPRTIAHLHGFSGTGYRASVLEDDTGTMREVEAGEQGVDIEVFTDATLRYLKNVLNTPAPATMKALGLWGLFDRRTTVQGRQLTGTDRAVRS